MIIKNLIYCALITLIAFCTPALADYNIVGDANNDGIITTADSLLALQMSVGSIVSDPEIADVNADGKVNSPDALMMLMMAQKAQVRVDTPEVVSGTFNAMIDIYNVADLDSGQFDLSFDASVVNVTGVDSGSIDGTEVPIDMWRFIDPDTIRVIFNLPDTTGVSGSGSLVTISFEIVGVVYDKSVLAISDVLLVDIESNEISSLWFDDEITVGILATVNAPEVVTGTFDATIDIADVTNLDSGQFDLSFDASVVNVTGVDSGSIYGTDVPTDMWRFIDHDTIRVIFNLPGTTGVSGFGSLATISFEVLGVTDDTSVLAISDGLLVDTESNEISSIWFDDEITVEVPVDVPVTVNAPPVVTDRFEVTIDVENVTDLDAGQFAFSFDPSVVTVEGVEAGSVGGVDIPTSWYFRDIDTIGIFSNIPGLKGASGSGCVARITFELTGMQGDSCVLDVSKGLLVNNSAEVIPSIWNDCEVTIGEYAPVNRVRNINTDEDFPFIRTAIDDPDTLDGHVIEVEDGVYHEYVQVTKSLTIRSLNGSANCVIQDVGSGHVVEITADHVNISGFTVTRRAGRSASYSAGIYLNASHCNVSGNTCSNKGVGIHLNGSGNNSISSNDCSHNFNGIHLNGSCDNSISSNDCSHNSNGIYLDGSCDNSISSNDCSHNSNGIYLDGSCDNSISSNNFSNNRNSIHLDSSGTNRLTGNIMFRGGIFIQGDSLNDYIHEIDESNIVNGKPVYYRKDIESGRIPDGTGQVILVNCRDILVEDQELNDASVSINVAFSSNITIRNNNCSNNNYAGIFLDSSSNSSISNNNCSNNNYAGIFLDGSSNSSISNNNCSGHWDGWGFFGEYGISLDGSDSNIISNNTCLKNRDGICIERSCSNVIYLNNFINRNYDYPSSTNIWNSTSKINYTYRENTFATYLGNYWGDYTGSDSDKDGIGDSPYRINSDNDNYPLMMPFENYFAPESTMARVCVNAPEVVAGTFDVMIDIHNVVDLDYGQFDLTFDPGVVNVTEVNDGRISDKQVPIDSWEFVGADTITVVFNSQRATGLRGSGRIATISFEVTGSQGDTSVLDISNGKLTDTVADEIPAVWNDSEVTVGVPVNVSAPEVVSIVSGVFNATIEIEDVVCMNRGVFDLSFDPGVVNVTDVTAGNINGTTIPIVDWRFMDANTIMVIFELSGDDAVSGSGCVARMGFEITGSLGDSCVLDMSNGEIVDTGGDEVPAIWLDGAVTIGVPVTVNAPPVVSGTFDATIDIADVTNLDSGQFDLSFNASVVNVTGVNSGTIDGTEVSTALWDFINPDTIRVLFNLPGITGVSGSGSLATISFEVLGVTDDTSVLAISYGLLVDTESN
ncbi:MAG: right-handed parallel beta-helix repeat-containing protein, partial [Methanosarcinales archaeon]|nr:right-handed parallel beta-helix repeat-containing protein [Methanosarcinales archaeon]